MRSGRFGRIIRRLSNVCKFLAGVDNFVENTKAQDRSSEGNSGDSIAGNNDKENTNVEGSIQDSSQ